LGPYEVANISGFAWFGPGGYMTVLAVGLLVVAYLARDLEATVDEIPALAGTVPGSIRGALAGRGTDESDGSGRERAGDRRPDRSGDRGGDHVD
jgi:hypothetical protein